ncbi:MAG TPA: SpoIIE family protein phosphatase [Terriglobia bacterium]|nr:SpoIIE family protein phosphatase [Terriglobia bacterium]
MTIGKTPRLRKPLLATLAAIFAAAVILYTGIWIYFSQWLPPVELGFDEQYVASGSYELVTGVRKDSPAERAGLQPGDRILKIDGHPLESTYALGDMWAVRHPGQAVDLTVQRPPAAAVVHLTGVLRAATTISTEGGITQHLGEDLLKIYPIGFLVVGLVVLILRPEDPNAWLLALMFAAFIAVPRPNSYTGMGPALRPFALAYRAIFDSMLAGFFYYFFSIFPTRSPLDQRASWLKWVGLGIGISVALPGLDVGDPRSPETLIRLIGAKPANVLRMSYLYGFVGLGLLSLVLNAFSAGTPETRRKIRVLLWGTLAGVVPSTLLLLANEFVGYRWPFWLVGIVVLLLWLLPVSFAYAVIKHRVLEIPVLLRRSARYLLVQRGFTILLALVSVAATLAFAVSFERYLEPVTGAGVPGVIALGTGFGTLLLWTGMQVHRGVGGRIDRAFFRNSYDARMILEELAERTRKTSRREELAGLLAGEISQALHPSFLFIYLERRDGLLYFARDGAGPAPESLSPDSPLLQQLARHSGPWEVPAAPSEGDVDLSDLGPVRPECLVPMRGDADRLRGVIVLGARLSEEPYSREDRRLLASVASQAGVALEKIRLAEEIAERMEAERRSAQEMDFARQVQARLFPQKLPQLKTLEYAGGCVQARQVGGDYYDFLDFGAGRMGLVLADIAGKGVSGALLMANLQANLRSQYALAMADLPGLLGSVNRLFHESTADESYATLFFGDYSDEHRVLRYANCGHNPPFLMRADGSVERLAATATVIGLFDDWACPIRETRLNPGDTLVVYTDGVTEAANAAGDEFGEDRLVEIVRAERHRPAQQLMEAISTAVRQFSAGEQADDVTLVVARGRAI